MHVLVVDSDRTIASQVKHAFEVAGNEVHVEHTAELGVQSVDDFTPDCVVLELALGRHNGLEFIYELRSYDDMMHIPIVLYTYVSPHDFTSDEIILKSLGISAFLQKSSASLQQLVTAVHRAVKQKVA